MVRLEKFLGSESHSLFLLDKLFSLNHDQISTFLSCSQLLTYAKKFEIVMELNNS